MAAPAAVINPANPFKSIAGPTWQRPPVTPVAGQQPLVAPSGPVFEQMGRRTLIPQAGQRNQPFGVPPPAPVGQQRQPSAPTFGGFSGNMGNHFNERFDEQTGQWKPVTIDATPGDAPSPNANPNMGLLGEGQFAVGASYADREAAAHNTSSFGMPHFAYGGNGVHTAIVGDPQADGGPNPEVVTSASPIRVVPMRAKMPMNMPYMAYGSDNPPPAPLPSDLVRGSGGVLELVNSPYAGHGPNFSTGGDLYDKPPSTAQPDIPFSGSVSADAPAPTGTFNPSAPQAPSPMDLAAQARSKMFGTQPTRYDNELAMRAELTANKGRPDLPDTSPLTGTPAAPSNISVPPAPSDSFAGPQTGFYMNGAVSDAVPPPAPLPPIPSSGSQPQPGALDAAANFRNAVNNPPPPGGIANPNMPPPAPQLGQIERTGPNPMDAWNRARNPQREQTAINRFVRHNPLALPQADIQREATRIKMNEERAKLDQEALQKHAETLRKTAHNVAQEQHWDDNITGKNAVDKAKNLETARKDHEKKVQEAADYSDAMGQVQTRIGMLSKSDPKYDQKLELLNHITHTQKTAKGAAAGAKYYDETFPKEPTEMNFGEHGGVFHKPGTFSWEPQPRAGKETASQTWLKQNIGK